MKDYDYMNSDDDQEDVRSWNGNGGKYAMRRDIARKGKFQKPVISRMDSASSAKINPQNGMAKSE